MYLHSCFSQFKRRASIVVFFSRWLVILHYILNNMEDKVDIDFNPATL